MSTICACPDLASLAAFIQQRRIALGLRQGQIAQRAGLAQPRISQLENAVAGTPPLRELVQVACALEVGLGELVSALGYDVSPPSDLPAKASRRSGRAGAKSCPDIA